MSTSLPLIVYNAASSFVQVFYCLKSILLLWVLIFLVVFGSKYFVSVGMFYWCKKFLTVPCFWTNHQAAWLTATIFHNHLRLSFPLVTAALFAVYYAAFM
jgi:hypothetical protein